MILDLQQLITKYNMNINNIIHVGGHFGKEVNIYNRLYPNVKVQIFEPHPFTFQILEHNVAIYPNTKCHNVALGSTKGKMNMYVETMNQGQSNSLLKPKKHTIQYPHITFNTIVEVEVNTLDSYNLDTTYNFLAMDVQGYELEVLKGSTETLKNINYLMTEVNREELYENCPMIEDIDKFLEPYNLKRVETEWEGGTWGDALYIKS